MAFKKIYSGKYLQPVIHVLFWVLVIILPYLSRNPNTYQGFTNWHYRLLINNILLAGLFYFNAYYLYPTLYKHKKWLLYVLSLMVVLAIIYLSNYLASLLFPLAPKIESISQNMTHFGPRPGSNGPGHPHFHPRPRFDRGGFDRGLFGWYFTNMITYVFIICIGTSYRIIGDNFKQEKIRKEKENENLKTELSFLRSQVSPHFIFNILNNMVSLARKKSDMLEPSLIELSKLMRYMLYENDDERVALSREVEYLKSYIALQLLRFGDDVTIMFNPPENINAYYIEPMLLAPFVENAFKHGVGIIDDPQINIVLKVDEATGWLDFKVMNTIAPQQHTKDKSSGIGLANVRRRLELLYREDYKLDIMQNDNVFIADLKLKLK